MASFKTGEVVAVVSADDRIVAARVDVAGDEVEAVGFPRMLGPVAPGDRVVINMTGIDLALGTGGTAFILWNLDGPGTVELGDGHIVKMRYTPWQTEVLSVEAPESPDHEALANATDLGGTPVVACGLHSQIGAAAAGIKARHSDARVGYLMTDGGALPLAWSKNVGALREAKLIDVTCTAGHAFGGDIEAVNLFSGLVALREAARVDAMVVAMGPGVVGTGTRLGTTAIEQGQVLDATTALGGRAIAALRISFKDMRVRHVGISHHTITALTVAARERCTIALPTLPGEQATRIAADLESSGLRARHDIQEVDAGPALRLLAERGLRPTSMGRHMDEAPELFAGAAAAGGLAGTFL